MRAPSDDCAWFAGDMPGPVVESVAIERVLPASGPLGIGFSLDETHSTSCIWSIRLPAAGCSRSSCVPKGLKWAGPMCAR